MLSSALSAEPAEKQDGIGLDDIGLQIWTPRVGEHLAVESGSGSLARGEQAGEGSLNSIIESSQPCPSLERRGFRQRVRCIEWHRMVPNRKGLGPGKRLKLYVRWDPHGVLIGEEAEFMIREHKGALREYIANLEANHKPSWLALINNMPEVLDRIAE